MANDENMSLWNVEKITSIHLGQFYLDFCYTPINTNEKKKCKATKLVASHNLQIVTSRINEREVTEQQCKEQCDRNKRCNFIFYNDFPSCALYEECKKYKKAYRVGTIFEKGPCQGTIDLLTRNNTSIVFNCNLF